MPAYTFQGRIERLEIARGYDGLLGGTPKPVVVVGVYAAYGASVRMLGRSLHRFAPRKPFPSDIATENPILPACALQSEVGFSFVALACALEDDGGADVQRTFGALERHDEITVFSTKHREVDPVTLGALDVSWSAPRAVELCVDGTSIAGTCRSDKWIGAVCWTMTPRPGPPVSIYRLPFLAEGGRNDWTAVVSIAH